MAKTKVKKQAQVVQEQAPAPVNLDFLSAEDLLRCETISRDLENSKLRMNVEEQNLKNLTLEMQLLEQKIKKASESVQEKARLYEIWKVKYNNMAKEMWPRYGVDPNSSKIGYDPISGKIFKD